jgi:hypothetical protein
MLAGSIGRTATAERALIGRVALLELAQRCWGVCVGPVSADRRNGCVPVGTDPAGIPSATVLPPA